MGHLTPRISFTASQQASTMSTRHTQSWHTHCQPTGTITRQSEYICPETRGSQAALSRGSSLCPPHWAPNLSSLLSPLTACGRDDLLNRQHSICLAPMCLSLSLLPVPDPLLLCLLSRPPSTYIHSYPRPRLPPSPFMGS